MRKLTQRGGSDNNKREKKIEEMKRTKKMKDAGRKKMCTLKKKVSSKWRPAPLQIAISSSRELVHV